MKFSLVIPAKNEEKRILLPLLDYYAALQRRFGPSQFEILIVVNNTTDQSVKTLNTIKKLLKAEEIRIFDIGKTESKGRAVVYGLKKAKGKVVGFTDADGSYNSHEVMRMYRKLIVSHADAVIPNRYSNESTLVGQLPFLRKVYSRIFNSIVRKLFGIKFKDTQGGLKLFTRNAIKQIIPQIVTFGWACDVNMLVALKNSGLSIVESPIEWTQQENSRLTILGSGVEIAREIWSLAAHQYVTKHLVALSLAKN